MRESDKQVENEALKLQNILDEKDQWNQIHLHPVQRESARDQSEQMRARDYLRCIATFQYTTTTKFKKTGMDYKTENQSS